MRLPLEADVEHDRERDFEYTVIALDISDREVNLSPSVEFFLATASSDAEHHKNTKAVVSLSTGLRNIVLWSSGRGRSLREKYVTIFQLLTTSYMILTIVINSSNSKSIMIIIIFLLYLLSLLLIMLYELYLS